MPLVVLKYLNTLTIQIFFISIELWKLFPLNKNINRIVYLARMIVVDVAKFARNEKMEAIFLIGYKDLRHFIGLWMPHEKQFRVI